MARAKRPTPTKAGNRPSSTGKVIDVQADQTGWRRRLQTSRLKLDDDAKEIYLRELADHGMKGRSAKAAGVSMETVNQHRENDPDFREGILEAMEAYRDKFVNHATTLAYEGIEVKKYNKDGDLIEERRDYPIRLIEMELKRVDPAYREKQTIDLNQQVGGVLVAPAGMTPEEFIKQSEEDNKRADARRAAQIAEEEARRAKK